MPFQKTKGGPIIAFQVENEYGDYTNQDRDHLPWLKKLMGWLNLEFLYSTTERPFWSDYEKS